MAKRSIEKSERAQKKSKAKIPIRCTYDALYSYDDLTPSQGDLKHITKDATQKLLLSIKNNGVVFPILFPIRSKGGICVHKGGFLFLLILFLILILILVSKPIRE